jgi:hypothetical protein
LIVSSFGAHQPTRSGEIRKRLSRRNTQRLGRTLLHNAIGILVGPKLEIRRAFARLVNLPNHPRDLEPVEDINVLAHDTCLVRARSSELFKEHEFLGGLSVLQCNGRFVAPFGDAAVGVDVDEVEGCAVPVLGDVRVGEFVAATYKIELA